MKKILATFVFAAVFAAYALSQRLGANPASGSVAIAPPASQSVPSGDTASLGQSVSGGAGSAASGYADGSYTGSVVNAYYGFVQVSVDIAKGKIADVRFLQYPNDRGTSRAINAQAMPVLTSEAVQAQSANVDGVTGASDTSAAFRESLASALAQASRA
jgi:uncharacterized protein with FMN-binding domain